VACTDLHFALSTVCILLEKNLLVSGGGVWTFDGRGDAVFVKEVDVGLKTVVFVMRIASDRYTSE
jgi:hypothetical protein